MIASNSFFETRNIEFNLKINFLKQNNIQYGTL